MRYALAERMADHPADPAEQAARHPRVDDHRALNGIFCVLRSGSPWRDLPDQCPYTTCVAGRRQGPDNDPAQCRP